MLALWEDKVDMLDPSESHWSTGTVLAIFFAATLISAVFFGLGYSLGHGGSSKPGFSSANLAAAFPAALPAGITSHSTLANLAAASDAQPKLAYVAPLHNPVAVASATVGQANSKNSTARNAQPPTAIKAVTVRTKAQTSPDARTTTSAKYMVQVGAIGNRKDARRLVTQLRKHGLRAGIYPAKHDKFLHVQIGPFTTVDQAQAARHHAMTNGFHAILKHAS